MNVATSAVASSDITCNICSNTRENGEAKLQNMLQTEEANFFAPIPKPILKTCSRLSIPIKPEKAENVEAIDIDKTILLFSKLIVRTQSRDHVLRYELAHAALSHV